MNVTFPEAARIMGIHKNTLRKWYYEFFEEVRFGPYRVFREELIRDIARECGVPVTKDALIEYYHKKGAVKLK